jgi:competence protein ComEA
VKYDAPVIVALVAALLAVMAMRLVRPVSLHEPGPVRPLPAITIDLNTAGVAELGLLPGIGPTLAERIVADRRRQGPFATIDDLHRVDGVGPVTVDRARALARTSSESE